MKKNNKSSVYFNGEYIGEAETFEWKQGNNSEMPILDISGEYQANGD